MKALKIFETLDFERGIDPKKSMKIGKHRTTPRTFKDYDGDEQTIEVTQDNTFKIADMEVRLEFKTLPDIGEAADVYVDGQKNDYYVFLISPAEYEFFVPEKPSIEIDGHYQSDPNPENWSKTRSAYGYPLVDKNDKKKLKEMQQKHGYWTAISGDYSRESKDPFVAVAQLILFTY